MKWTVPDRLRADALNREVIDWDTLTDAANHIERLQRDCAEAYQVVGMLAHAHGNLFEDPQVIKALDNLSAACDAIDPRPHDDLLPFTPPLQGA